MTGSSSVDRIAEFVLNTGYDSLPETARAAAKVFLLDSIGVGIAACNTDIAARVRTVVEQWGHGDDATILGSGARLPATSAAFQNSFQIHCQEFDSLHEPATVHAMAVLTGALLAAAEVRDWTGEDLLLGVAVGVEVTVTLGLAATRGLSFFRPATAGALGTTAALARLAGLDGARFRNAWGLAYSQLAGTMQAHVEGSVALPIQVAAAARAAMTSLQLAEAGLDGPHDILEGPFGYFQLFEPDGDVSALVDTLGTTWRVTELSHKPFPTGRAAHGALEAIVQLRAERPFRLDELARLTAQVPPLVKRLVARPIRADMTPNYARLCLPYLAPLCIRQGTVDTTDFSAENLNDSDIHAHAGAVHIVDDGNPDPNALGPQRIVVELRDGSTYDVAIPDTLGSPANPLSRTQYLDKFHRCLAAAGFPADRARQLERLLEDAESVTSAREIVALCGPASP